jgi:hypothetical protein
MSLPKHGFHLRHGQGYIPPTILNNGYKDVFRRSTDPLFIPQKSTFWGRDEGRCTGIPHLALLLVSSRKTEHYSTNWVTQKGKRSETKMSNITLHYHGFRQERYSETALSEARYSGGYLYASARNACPHCPDHARGFVCMSRNSSVSKLQTLPALLFPRLLTPTP